MKRLLLAIAICFSFGTAHAGFTNLYQANVNTASKTFYGSMVGARNSADNTQYISCAYIAFSTNPYIRCSARNSAGITGSCTSTQPQHFESVAGLNNESYLYVQYDDAGKCTYIYSAKGSMFHE